MNEAKPGTAADFKQRREAYQMPERLRDSADAASFHLENDRGKQAVKALAPTMEAIERNPHAARVIEKREPSMLEAAREFYQRAKEAAPYEVRHTHSGGRVSDGYTSAELEFGKSDKGHHYRLHRETQSWHNDPSWSRPLASEDAARAAGRSAQRSALGGEPIGKHPAPERTPRGQHAEALQKAAAHRQLVQANSAGKRDADWAEAAKHKAVLAVSEAVKTRTEAMERAPTQTRYRGQERER